MDLVNYLEAIHLPTTTTSDALFGIATLDILVRGVKRDGAVARK